MDGAAKTREVKLCTVWSAEGRDAEGVPVRDAGSVSCSAAIESAATRDTEASGSAFGQRVQREGRRRGVERAQRQAVLGDGAPWIWNLAGEYFPEALQIVDRFHAKAHLSGVATVLYGAPSDLGDAWAKARHAELDAGRLSQIAAALATQYRARRDPAKRQEVRKCLGYLWTNRRHMRYPAFRAQGLFRGRFGGRCSIISLVLFAMHLGRAAAGLGRLLRGTRAESGVLLCRGGDGVLRGRGAARCGARRSKPTLTMPARGAPNA